MTRAPLRIFVRWEATVAGRRVGSGVKEGTIDLAQTLFVPAEFDIPEAARLARLTAQITMSAEVGQAKHEDRFDFRVFAPRKPLSGTFAAYDPAGDTTKLLHRLGCSAHEWDQGRQSRLIAIGRSALWGAHPSSRAGTIVRAGGRAVVFIQDPEFMRNRLVCALLAYVAPCFPVSAGHPVVMA